MQDFSSETKLPSVSRLAVLIGIDEYQNGVPKLRNAKNDVLAVSEILSRDHGYTVRQVVNTHATLAKLKALFEDLAEKVTAQHHVVIYFAGHGIALETEEDHDGPQGFLLPQDASRADVQTYLSMSELQDWLMKLGKCSHLLLFLDCCFAGAFRWSSTRSLATHPVRLYRERFERYVRDPTWQVITSAAHDETALDTVAGGKLGQRDEKQRNSPFASALCDGLKGAADFRVGDRPGDGVIVASELHLYLESRFAQLERQSGVAHAKPRQVQRPMLWSLAGRDKGQFIFIVPGRSPDLLESALELNERNNPYRGLEPYDQEHAALFFGRQEVTAKLFEHVCSRQFTVVLGVSGSGKSSLVRAGLLPRFKADSQYRILPVVRPGAKPLVALSAVGAALGATGLDLPSAIIAACQNNATDRFLLVIDQLEELVTMESSAAEGQDFFAQLARAGQLAGDRLRIVMTLRSDYEPHFAALLPVQTDAPPRFLVPSLSREELRDVIEGPAVDRVLFFEPPALVTRLIEEVADMPGALPLLSFALSEMYRSFLRRSPGDRTLRPQDMAFNGVAGALSRRADEIYESLDRPYQMALRYLMLRMVTLEGGEPARRRVMLAELVYDGPLTERVNHVRKVMLDARLLVSGNDPTSGNGVQDVSFVEPAHDKLVVGWPALKNFIKEERDSLPLQRRLTQAAKDWGGMTGDPRHLWASDPRLPQILPLLQERPERFNLAERAFISASEARRRSQRLFTTTLVVTIIAVLSGITIYALTARNHAVTAQLRAETAQQNALTAQAAEREQRLRAEAEEKVAQESRAKAEKAQYRAQIRAAAAAVEANQLPTALESLLGTTPAYRDWEWAYLLARTGPRPTKLSELSRFGELGKRLQAFPAAQVEASEADPNSDDEKEDVPTERRREVPTIVLNSGGVRNGGTLSVQAKKKNLMTITTGLYGQIKKPRVADDASVLVTYVNCGEVHHSSCETGANEVLSDGAYVFGLPPVPTKSVTNSVPASGKRKLSAAQRAFFAELKMDPEADLAQLPFEQWLTCGGRPCALVMQGSGAKALWQVSPPKLIRTLELPESAKPAHGSAPDGATGDETKEEEAIGYDHAGCVSEDGKYIFGFPIGSEHKAVIFSTITGKPILTLKDASGKPAEVGGELETWGSSVCYFSPTNKEVVRVSASRNDMLFNMWSTSTGAPIYQPPSTSSSQSQVPLGVAWDTDGEYFAIYEKDRTLNIYDGNFVGTLLVSLKSRKIDSDIMVNPPFRMLLSPDEKRLVVGTYLMETEPLTPLLELSAQISPDWRSFTTTGTYKLAFWEAYQGKNTGQLTLRDRLLLWQIKQADELRIKKSKTP